MSDDIVTRLHCAYGDPIGCGQCTFCLVKDEIERLNREVLQLQGVVRAHEGMYAHAAERIDLLRGWLERSYRLAVGHGPNWHVFDSWEEAIKTYEEARLRRLAVDDIVTMLRKEYDHFNQDGVGDYELLTTAADEIERLLGYQAGYAGLIEDNSTYEDEVDRLRAVIRNYIKAEQDLQHATNDHFVVNYDEEVYEAHEAWKASWRALEKEANLEQ